MVGEDTVYQVYLLIDSLELVSFNKLVVLNESQEKIITIKSNDLGKDPAITAVGENYRIAIDYWKMHSWNTLSITNCELQDIAFEANKVILGWINYYGHFYKTELKYVLEHIDTRLAIWAQRKYKRLRGRKKMAIK